MTIWLNGALTGNARIDPTDRGFTLGDGLFETIRAVDARPAFLDRHLARLRDGAALLGIPVAWSDSDIASAIASLLKANRLTDSALRLTLTRGPAPRGVLPPSTPSPTMVIAAGPLPVPPAPAYVIVATVTRRNEASPLSRIKSLNYLDSILARREAAERGADDAILLNTRGATAEATAANLFAMIEGTLVTPPIADGALPGILRGLLIERGGVIERTLSPDDLPAATAAFLSNSLSLRAISRIDGHDLPDGSALVARLWANVTRP